MPSPRRVWLLAALASLSLSGTGVAQSPVTRDISVEDLARYAQVGIPASATPDSFRTLAQLSPSGQYAAIVVTGGNLSTETNDATIYLHDTQNGDLRLIERIASAGNFEAVSNLRWLSDEALAFVATERMRPSQLVHLDIRTRRRVPLTFFAEQFFWAGTNSAADRIAVIFEPPLRPMDRDPTCRRTACLIQGSRIWNATNRIPDNFNSPRVSLFDRRGRELGFVSMPNTSDPALGSCFPELFGQLSPRGRYGFVRCGVRFDAHPSSWQAYSGSKIASLGARMRLYLLDFETQTSREVSTAPWMSGQPAPIWVSKHEAIFLDALDEDPTSPPGIIRFDAVDGSNSFLAASPEGVIAQAALDEDSRAIFLDYNITGGVHRFFALSLDDYSLMPTPYEELHGALRFEYHLSQTLESPPRLMRTDRQNNRTVKILDPNPWLRERRLGSVEEVQWRTRNNSIWRGVLYLPPDYVPGRRYPVLLQTHGAEPGAFTLNGMSRNFPGRALVARGIVVLQINENHGEGGRELDTREEWPAVQAGYEGAIDYVVASGLADPHRIGMIGWSRTGPHVGYTLTHTDYDIAAAAFTSTGDFGWFYYVASGAPPSYDNYYDAAPFGGDLTNWLEDAPSFNLDRVQTPMLMWANNRPWALWDWYAGLRRLDKPVEYWYLPDGVHNIFQVPQLTRTNELLVDWFVFWLRDKEDPDPAKSEQYERWRQLREQQSRSASGERRPLLRWHSAPY